MLAHRNFHVVDELPQDVRHGGAFLVGQNACRVEKKIADDFGQLHTPRR